MNDHGGYQIWNDFEIEDLLGLFLQISKEIHDPKPLVGCYLLSLAVLFEIISRQLQKPHDFDLFDFEIE